MLHVIVNCGWCENVIARCISSLRSQTVTEWRAHVTVDRSGDDTFRNAVAASAGDPRFDIVQNARRRYPMDNILRAIARSHADADDVIVIVDGDDWLIDDRAFETITGTYETTGCWVTYGSWISNDPRKERGMWPPYEDGETDFRAAPWRGTAVRTWKKWLFDLIDDRDFRDESGRYFRRTEDAACMMPLIEMATTRRAKHIAEPLMLYNCAERISSGPELVDEGKRNMPYLRSRRAYRPLAERPCAPPNTQRFEEEAHGQ
ncbi:MAG TPA: glycosyltransferase family A protein [Thermoanaerobaculia bacterium]|nr:glycosyltransferase family A protein [Thermoanaerobaculia bacterium]